jgi:hypothetical protein
MVDVPYILPSFAHSTPENSCTKLTSSGEITELKVLLEKKKEEKLFIKTQYKPLETLLLRKLKD